MDTKSAVQDQATAPARLPTLLERYDSDKDGQLSAPEISAILSSPERGRVEEEIAFLVTVEILAAAKNARNKLVPTEGISFDEFSILAILRRDLEINKSNSGYLGLSQSLISSEINLPASTVSIILERLARGKGNDKAEAPWIERIENPTNRREKLIKITPEGKANLRNARKDYKAQIRTSLLAILDIPQMLELRQTLFRFNVSLNPKHDPSGGDSQDAETAE